MSDRTLEWVRAIVGGLTLAAIAVAIGVTALMPSLLQGAYQDGYDAGVSAGYDYGRYDAELPPGGSKGGG